MVIFDDGFDDSFGGPPEGFIDHGRDFFIDPLTLLIIFGVAAVVLLIWWGAHRLGERQGLARLKRDKADAAERIYDSIKYYLEQALSAPGAAILERARAVNDVIDSRLGFVMALTGKPGKLIEDLSKAINATTVKAAVPPAHKVKVGRPTEEHYLEVWKALQALAAFWNDKKAVKALIEAAQEELCRIPELPKEAWMTVPGMAWPWDKPASASTTAASAGKTAAAIVGGALNDADKAGSRPLDSAVPREPDPAPPPKSGPPPGRGNKPLPKHKRNMLA